MDQKKWTYLVGRALDSDYGTLSAYTFRCFTKGADRAGVSQSTISVSIAKLEAEFSVRLLERRSPVVPTRAGQLLFEASKAILQTCSTVKGELEAIAKPKLLRIGILQSFSSRQVSKLLGDFRDANSRVAIEVCDLPSEQLLELLAGQQLDAVLTIFDDSTSKFASRVLFKDPYVLAVPATHRFAKRDCVMIADLQDEPFIVRPSCDRFKDASNGLASRGIKIRVVYRTAQIDRTLALIAAGIGLSFIPARLVTPAVKQVHVIDMDFSRTFGLLWAHEPEDDLKEFIKFAEDHSSTL